MRILRYLRGTWDFGIHYVHTDKPATLITNDNDFLDNPEWNKKPITKPHPVGYADSSYAQEEVGNHVPDIVL